MITCPKTKASFITGCYCSGLSFCHQHLPWGIVRYPWHYNLPCQTCCVYSMESSVTPACDGLLALHQSFYEGPAGPTRPAFFKLIHTICHHFQHSKLKLTSYNKSQYLCFETLAPFPFTVPLWSPWLFQPSPNPNPSSAICDFLRREDELMTELMNHKRSTS
jgi:hypothetical protein